MRKHALLRWLGIDRHTELSQVKRQSGPRRRLQLEMLEDRLVPAVAGTLSQNFVAQVYVDQLGRQVDPSGLAFWSGLVDRGVSRIQVVLAIQNSPEFRAHDVTAAYQNILGRNPDPGGLTSLAAILERGGHIEQVEDMMYGSTEFFLKNGATNDSFLSAVFIKLLGRATVNANGQPIDPVDPDNHGVRADWDRVLASGASRQQVAALIDSGTESLSRRVALQYLKILGRTVDSTGLTNFVALSRSTGIDFISALLSASEEHLQGILRSPPVVPGINITTTQLMSSATAALALDTAVTFTATVSPSTDGRFVVTSDSVVFKDEQGSTIGTSSLSGNGTASLTTQLLPAGDHQITAFFAGDVNFAPSASAPVRVTVNKATPSTALRSSNPIARVGDDVTFTATVVGQSNFPPTGNVTLIVDGVPQQAVSPVQFDSVTKSFAAVFHISSLSAQTTPHRISARYNGDANYNSSTNDNTIDQKINLASAVTPTVTISVDPGSSNPSVFGTPVTFDVTLSVPQGFTLAGTLVFTDESVLDGSGRPTQLGSPISVGGPGPFMLTTSQLNAGQHQIKATFTPTDTTNFNTGSGSLIQTVTSDTTALSLTPGSPQVQQLGDRVTFTATVTSRASGATPTGRVDFRLDGNSTLVDLDSAGKASFMTPALSGGAHTVTATYLGAGNFSPSSTQSVAFSAPRASTTTAILDLVSYTNGPDVNFRVRVSSTNTAFTPTGTVSISAASNDGRRNFSTTATLSNGIAIGTILQMPAPQSPGAGAAAFYTITATYVPGSDPNFTSSQASSRKMVFVEDANDSDTTETDDEALPGGKFDDQFDKYMLQ